MRRLAECRLYGILDLSYVSTSEVLRAAAELIEGGVDLIQLRGKQQSLEELTGLAAALHRLTFPSGTPLIINDHAEIARRVALEGVHVGQDDPSIAEVRAQAGRSIVIGKSTHTLDQAATALRDGADYIGFGPLFATPTKPDYEPIGLADVGAVQQIVSIPIFCIGGIKRENLREIVAAGARRVVIVSALLNAANRAEYAREVKSFLTSDH